MDHPAEHTVEHWLLEYQQRRVGRREALRLIAAATGSVTFAAGILAACAPVPPAPQAPAAAPPAPPALLRPTPVPTPEAAAQAVTFAGQGATLQGYLARPAGSGPFPAVLICHENRGLLDHFKDVARRFSGEGYVALAVDLLSREGGTDKIPAADLASVLGQTPTAQRVQDFQSGLRYLQTLTYVRADRIGMVGYCFGGGVTWNVAARTPELRAAVPYYGPAPALDEIANIRAPVLAIYGELDPRINLAIPDVEAAMQAHGKTFEKMIYAGALHAFFNDTGANYNAEAAQDAWPRTLAWFEKYLKA